MPWKIYLFLNAIIWRQTDIICLHGEILYCFIKKINSHY